MVDKTSEQKQGLGRRGKTLIGIGIILIIVLLVFIIILLLKGMEKEEPKRNVVINQENAEEVVSEMISQEYVPPGYYSASMTTTWHFETGDSVSEDAYVANKEENTNDVYFDLYLDGQEDEPILQSPIIPRGSELENITLDKKLDAGTYDCVMIYHLVDSEQKTVSTLRVGLIIIVEN